MLVARSIGPSRALPALLTLGVATIPSLASAQDDRPVIPRTWDEAKLATLELPNAATGRPARHVDAAFYEAIPEMVIYRTYPVYHPDHEPEGYLDRLREVEPEVVFDAGTLRSEADWVRAGEIVFHWPRGVRETTEESRARFHQMLAEVEMPITADGVVPFYVYVIREKGRIEAGDQSCAMCHTRVMPDGSVILGAQGNLPFDRLGARGAADTPLPFARATATALFGMPKIPGVAPPFPPDLTPAQLAAAWDAIPPGVLARHGTSAFAPVQVPDLIGVAERKYLDRTGLVRHRDVGDLMRYAALNQGLDFLSEWNGFVPDLAAIDIVPDDALPPDAPPREERLAQARDPGQQLRYSDAQLYALGRYLYSLAPPPSPHPLDEHARRGREVFEREDCARCHTPPLYTSNQLTPVDGFRVPPALRETEDIRRRGVGTDPTLALTTRRGTGFYKVPSLKGVWYRGPFSHDGSVATLEDWFDPRRVEDDYVPTGWNPGGGPRAVRGHRFGLDLPADERAALIAFLRTL